MSSTRDDVPTRPALPSLSAGRAVPACQFGDFLKALDEIEAERSTLETGAGLVLREIPGLLSSVVPSVARIDCAFREFLDAISENPDVARLRNICMSRFNSELSAFAARRLRSEVCDSSGLKGSEADALPLSDFVRRLESKPEMPEVPPALTEATSNPAKPDLVEALRRLYPRAKTKIALVSLMMNRESASFDEIARHVYDEGVTSEATIRTNLARTNEALVELGATFVLRVGSGVVFKDTSPE